LAKLFTEEEYEALVLSYIEGAGARGATEEEITRWVHWCEEIEVARVMVTLAIEGDVIPYYDETIEDYIFTKKGSLN
jgi:hypothetical protein